MACGKVYFIYALFTCEGVEENAFTEKDIVKCYMWWGKRGNQRIVMQRLCSLLDGDPTLSCKLVHEKETVAFAVTEKPTPCLS